MIVVARMTVPAAFAAGALYDNLLQEALRRFFPRAVLETESVLSLSSSGRLSMDPTADPAALAVRWFGTRHVLRVPERQPFTVHEVRLARAIGAVLSARYRAVFEPEVMTQRPELFEGDIEDRYVGAFLDPSTYGAEEAGSRADRIASAIEVMRVAALSSYENRPISSGVLLLDAEEDPCAHAETPAFSLSYSQQLTSVKAFYRLCNGVETLFLVARDGRLLSTVDTVRWSNELRGDSHLTVPCARTYRPHARATQGNRHVCVVLSPSHEIKVFAEGVQMFAFRNAEWRLLDLEAHYETWVTAVGNRAGADRLFQAALDLADARQGALFVILREPREAMAHLVRREDQLLGAGEPVTHSRHASRRELLSLLAARDVLSLDRSVLEALASLDGATVLDRDGRVLAAGAILRHPPDDVSIGERVEGARTTAAVTASRFGPVLKVSEDGLISFFDRDRQWDL
jgi:hypothetical protein